MLTLRLGLFQCDPGRAKELAQAVIKQKNKCDTVWLTTIGYYPAIDFHREIAECWKEAAGIFRNAGINVSLQVANTVGHSDWEFLKPEYNHPLCAGMRENGEMYETLVVSSGVKNSSRYCWRGKRFRKYIIDTVSVYTEAIKPDRIWFDDDLRAMGKTAGCYCDSCLAEFNKQYGFSYDRETLVEKMDYEDVSLRKKYTEFVKDGLYDFTYEVAKALTDVFPNISFGYEYSQDNCYCGPDINYIIKGFYDASKKEVHVRPGGGNYNDKAPYGQFEKASALSYCVAQLPDYVSESVAEIENLPGTAYGKSLQGIVSEGTLDLAVGCSDLSFTDVQSLHEPIEYFENQYKTYSDVLPYWEKLSGISQNAIRSGACIYTGKEPHLRQISRKEKSLSWTERLKESDYRLMRLGIPLTFDKRKPDVYILHNYNTAALSNDEIEFLLQKPVVADGESIAILTERGYGKYFDFTLEEVKDDNAYEVYPDGSIYYENPYAVKPVKRYLYSELNENSKVIGNMHRNFILDDGRHMGVTAIVTQLNTTGAKWAVFGYSLFGDLVSEAKRTQILEAMDEISPLCAKLVSCEQAAIFPSVDRAGKTVSVTMASASQNGTERTKLLVRNPVGENFSIMSASVFRKRNAIPLTYIPEKQEDGSFLIEMPELLPYEVITLFIEE